MTSTGWSAMLNLVCDNSTISDVMDSNHSVYYVHLTAHDINAIARALGIDDAHLLDACASNELYNEGNKILVARRKILWSHARGNLNIGDSSITNGAMPRILAWIGDYSNETHANLIQYHEPPLPNARVDTVRLDSFYRILQSMPDLCMNDI